MPGVTGTPSDTPSNGASGTENEPAEVNDDQTNELGNMRTISLNSTNEQPVREITLTDFLNRNLLASFARRMDERGTALARMLEPDDDDEPDEEDSKFE